MRPPSPGAAAPAVEVVQDNNGRWTAVLKNARLYVPAGMATDDLVLGRGGSRMEAVTAALRQAQPIIESAQRLRDEIGFEPADATRGDGAPAGIAAAEPATRELRGFKGW